MKLVPYRKKDKWGFSDFSKNILIECKYDKIIVPYKEDNFGLALVEQKNKSCWIDINGNELTPFADKTHLFTEKEISVIILNKFIDTVSIFPNCCFVNPKGETIFNNDYLTSNQFQNGYCIVMNKEKRYGAIDFNGELVIPFKSKDYNIVWESIGKPSNTDAKRSKKIKSNLSLSMAKNRYYGFRNIIGDFQIPAKYFKAFEFSDGIAVVAEKLKEFYFINELGNQIIDKTYYFSYGFSDGIAKVVTNQIEGDPTVHSRWGVDYAIPTTAKWGYVDTKGNEYWED